MTLNRDRDGSEEPIYLYSVSRRYGKKAERLKYCLVEVGGIHGRTILPDSQPSQETQDRKQDSFSEEAGGRRKEGSVSLHA